MSEENRVSLSVDVSAAVPTLVKSLLPKNPYVTRITMCVYVCVRERVVNFHECLSANCNSLFSADSIFQ